MLTRLVEVRSSDIHGRGCFAGVDLMPGTCVPIPYSEVKNATEYTFELDGRNLLVYNPYRYLNHGPNPNADTYLLEDGVLMLEIVRVVSAGEELTINYGEDWDVE